MRASGCTFPSASASREGSRRTGRPSVQCADAQPRVRDDSIFRRELFQAGGSERNAAPKTLHVSREPDPAPSQEFGGGNAGIVGYLAEPHFGGVAALHEIFVA